MIEEEKLIKDAERIVTRILQRKLNKKLAAIDHSLFEDKCELEAEVDFIVGQAERAPRLTNAISVRDGNFTTVVLNGKWIGTTKRMPDDVENPITGITIALYRAVTHALQAQ